jgi:hypothetical protein
MSFQIDASTASIIVAFIALAGTIFNAIISNGKMNRDEAVRWENRITKIEQKIEDKLEPLYEVIENEIPRLLIKENTPELDALLKIKINDLNLEETQRMLVIVESEYDKVLNDESLDRSRGMMLAFVRAILRKKFKEAVCK